MPLSLCTLNNVGGSNPIQVIIPAGSSQLFIAPLDGEDRCNQLRVLAVQLDSEIQE